MEEDQNKRFAWGHTYTETQAPGTTYTSTKPQKPNAAPPAAPGKAEGCKRQF